MKQEFDVKGMTCAACQATVERDIAKLEGVKQVQVSLLTNSMIVDFDEHLESIQSIQKQVKKSGYSAKAKTDDSFSVDNESEKNLRFRLIFSTIFFVPLILITMGPMLGLPLPMFLQGTAHAWILVLFQMLFVFPIVIVNRAYFVSGWSKLWKRRPNMDSLIAVGSSAAIIYSLLQTFLMIEGTITNNPTMVEMASMHLYYEAAGSILTLVTIGKYLESVSKGRTKSELKRLLSLSPTTALRMDGDKVTEIALEDIQLHDHLLVRPGMKFPVDGILIAGKTSVNESMMSGESIPVDKKEGDEVISATLNLSGSVTFEATRIGKDTTLRQIIHLVEQASMTKAPIQKLADRISLYFVPTVMGIAFVAFVVWMILGQPFSFSLSIGITILVISCPCALGLATPVAMMVGTGKGAQNGILIKSADSLQRSEQVNTVILDKTGTITLGIPKVQDFWWVHHETPQWEELSGLELHSSHPLAKALVQYVTTLGLIPRTYPSIEELPGQGLHASLDGILYLVGNQDLLSEHHVSLEPAKFFVENATERGEAILYFAIEGTLVGVVSFADEIKPDSLRAIATLKAMDMNVVMLTGDNERSAKYWKKVLDIHTVYANVRPDGKEAIIKEYQSRGKVVAMVGDGINDAIALTRADVGIAIGAGADIAIEAADIVLVHNRLMDVVKALRLSKKTMNVVRMNLFWAFFYNVLGIPLASGLFYMSYGIILTPMIGSFAMSLSSVTVVLNALRLTQIPLFHKNEVKL